MTFFSKPKRLPWREYWVLVCFTVLGFGPFATFNAFWCEEPYLVLYDVAKESVGAYIGGFANASMIVMLVLALVNRFVRKIDDVAVTAVCLLLGAVSGAMIAFLEPQTVEINGQPRSLYLWIASFLSGLCGNVCVFTMFSFAAKFKPSCTSALGTGLNMNGIVAALLAIIQRPGEISQMRFSFQTFMLLNGGVCLLSLASLLWLHFVELPRIERLSALVDDTDEQSRLLTGDSVNDDDDDDAVAAAAPVAAATVAPAARSNRHLLRVVFDPLAAGFMSSICAYFFNPGLAPYLSANGSLISNVIMGYMVASTLGALATVKIVRNLWGMVFWCAINLVYLCAVGSQRRVPLPEWALYVATINLGFFNAYVTTGNFVIADMLAREDGRSEADAHRARGYAAVINQLGVIGGSYLLVAAVAGDLFQAKEHIIHAVNTID